MQIRSLPSGRFLTGTVIGLVLGLLSALWLSDRPLLQQAHAQVPDAGAQRIQIRKELLKLNSNMDQIIKLLKSGQIKVICVQADDKEQE